MSELIKFKNQWDRIRFRADEMDFRPVKWPPLGPYWCSGCGDGYSIVVAYVPRGLSDRRIKEYWPEAACIDRMQEGVALEYSDRFQEPEWWKKMQKAEKGKQ